MRSRPNVLVLTMLLAHTLGLVVFTLAEASVQSQPGQGDDALKLPSQWECSAPLVAPEKRDRYLSRAQKDPTIVLHDGRWHLFMTVKLPGRSAIEYCSFESRGERIEG